jgi:hypothetical protein
VHLYSNTTNPFKNMKKLSVLILFAAFSFGVSSCQKCAECTCGNETETRCVDDFNSKDDYDQAVNLLQGLGCDCNESLKPK